ncbi:hypothetical protein ACOME3_010634 [Neoechinorhynchus agilis]
MQECSAEMGEVGQPLLNVFPVRRRGKSREPMGHAGRCQLASKWWAMTSGWSVSGAAERGPGIVDGGGGIVDGGGGIVDGGGGIVNGGGGIVDGGGKMFVVGCNVCGHVGKLQHQPLEKRSRRSGDGGRGSEMLKIQGANPKLPFCPLRCGNVWGLGRVGISPPEGLGETNLRGDWRAKIDVVLGAKYKHCGAAGQCG